MTWMLAHRDAHWTGDRKTAAKYKASLSSYSHVRRFKMQAMLSIGLRASVEWMIAARMAGDTAAKRRWIQL